MSSSIFDGISAGMVRQPQVSMNAGPLPTAAPPYFPSARINYASDLLGEHIDAYSYGKADHVSDQTAYLNIAHRIQKIVPQISLPNASSEGTFQLSHAVDVGDIGFVLRIDRRGGVVPNIHAFDRLQLGRMVDPMVNLVTVNYILAGLQRFWTKREAANWQQLMVDLEFVDDAYAERSPFSVGDALRFISDIARPFGVPHTSELQGGQHEGGSGPVTYPVNFISAFVVSGLTRNMCNIWSKHNGSSGDDLIMKLEKLPISSRDGSIKYHLNHWKKSMAVQQFKYEDGGINEAWQLVPTVLTTYTPPRIIEGYDYRENGYWHICRTQVMFRGGGSASVYHDDRAGALQGALLEGTFEPVWIEYTPWKKPLMLAGKRNFDGGMVVQNIPRAIQGDRVFVEPGPRMNLGTEAPSAEATSAQDMVVELTNTPSEPSSSHLLSTSAPSEKTTTTQLSQPPPTSKKPRRALALATGVGSGSTVLVQTLQP